ncbi:hypothetical protein DV451_002432 [Geotrichum candidum]|uniref:Cation efflux protein transmembrane domain-containing protein n=1 Tax=Geotrichum candidum TaxID=1173061 RepID=A0A9P5KTI1_GEOCN|nr:hypothetical protein DV451_002432 [Geotrichum candidum]KAF5110663.1 hypothetical protein DV453_000720 [Geotrichum candidum]
MGQDHTHTHSLFSSHSHSHSHSHSAAALGEDAAAAGGPGAFRVTLIGLAANVLMAASKFAAGTALNSQALLADALHSASDLIADAVTLLTIVTAGTVAVDRFPFGAGKIETLGSAVLAVALLGAGLSIFRTSFTELTGIKLDILTAVIGHGHSHSHSHSHSHDGHGHSEATDPRAVWIAAISVAIKELLFRVTMRVAESTGSAVLVASAWHHRLDALASVIAVFAIGGGWLFGVTWLDSAAGLFVAALVLRAGWAGARGAVLELVDSTAVVDPAAPAEVTRALNATLVELSVSSCGRYTSDDFAVRRIELLKSGPGLVALVQLRARSGAMSAAKAVAATDYVETELLKAEPRLRRVVVSLVGKDAPADKEKDKKQKHS